MWFISSYYCCYYYCHSVAMDKTCTQLLYTQHYKFYCLYIHILDSFFFEFSFVLPFSRLCRMALKNFFFVHGILEDICWSSQWKNLGVRFQCKIRVLVVGIVFVYAQHFLLIFIYLLVSFYFVNWLVTWLANKAKCVDC